LKSESFIESIRSKAPVSSYGEQDLARAWVGGLYRRNYERAVYEKEDVPFPLSEITNSEETVLEIGSSMGQCYRWLTSNGIDLGPRYTGIDISEDGISHCRSMYPRTHWIRGDFLSTIIPGSFDYTIERNAIHHMANPTACLKKAISLTRKGMTFNMRCRIRHPSLSDLSRAYFLTWSDDGKHVAGRYYFNLLNLADIIRTVISSEGVQSVMIALSPHFDLRIHRGTEKHPNYIVPDDVYDAAAAKTPV